MFVVRGNLLQTRDALGVMLYTRDSEAAWRGSMAGGCAAGGGGKPIAPEDVHNGRLLRGYHERCLVNMPLESEWTLN